MKIKPIDRDVRSLFESHFFVIPRFQRPYSWDRENLADFWTDVCETTDDDYFIGSMVVYREGQHATETNVVDGQQRLTTIILPLCVIRDRLLQIGEEALARGLHGLVERPDLDSRKRYTLFSETPYPYLQDRIQKLGEPELKLDVGPEEVALKAAYDEFCERLDAKLVNVENQPGNRKQKDKNKVDFLKDLRDRVLRFQTILIELDDEDDAYLIFETLNTRGKDLQPADLVKNHLTRLLKAPNSDNVRYILEKFDSYFGKKGRVIDYDQMTIEHIASQSTKGFTGEEIGSIGNLIFVPPKLNNEELADKDFLQKRKLYATNDIAMDNILLSKKKWNGDAITERAFALSEVAYQEIWTL